MNIFFFCLTRNTKRVLVSIVNINIINSKYLRTLKHSIIFILEGCKIELLALKEYGTC